MQFSLTTTLKTAWTEARGALWKALATAVVAGGSALALAHVKPVNDYFNTQITISHWEIVCRSTITGTVTALLVFCLCRLQISRLKKSLKQLREVAATDLRTGLYNSTQIKPMLAERFAQAKADGQTFSLIMVDVDEFKRINDSYTHEIGNFVLKQVADQLPGRRGGDLSFRDGGDEFLIISKTTTREDEGYGFAERIRRDISDYKFRLEENSSRRESLTVSCGVTGYVDGDSLEQLLTRVTEALHAAKRPRIDVDGVERAKNFVYVSHRPKSV